MTLTVPASYMDGYAKAREDNPAVAKNYVAHTTVGDPLADRLVEDANTMDSRQFQKFIRMGMMGKTGDSEFRAAPDSIKDFFVANENPPNWVDLESFRPGIQMFHNNTRLVLAGMVGGVLVEGFSTNISKSFFLTGRLRDKGIRRLQQNNRQMLEIFMPDGMQKFHDGWILSIRIRMIHAKIRSLIQKSTEWDEEELGIPISSANLGFAIASFSARLLYYLDMLGASISKEERESFMQVWRYSGYLMGIPESILYTNEDDALELNRIGRMCEPSPSLESIVMASALINSAPLLAGIEQRNDRKNLVKYITRLSRAMIGEKLADDLKYDKLSTYGALWRFRFLNKLEDLFSFTSAGNRNTKNMMTALEVSMYNEDGISYKLPDHLYAEESTDW